MAARSPRGGPIWVAVPVERAHGSGQLGEPGLGRGVRRFVGVEAHGDVELRRVVAVHEGDVVPGLIMGRSRHGPGSPNPFSSCRWRSRTDSAWVAKPSAWAMVATTGAARENPSASTVTTCTCLVKSSTVRALP